MNGKDLQSLAVMGSESSKANRTQLAGLGTVYCGYWRDEMWVANDFYACPAATFSKLIPTLAAGKWTKAGGGWRCVDGAVATAHWLATMLDKVFAVERRNRLDTSPWYIQGDVGEDPAVIATYGNERRLALSTTYLDVVAGERAKDGTLTGLCEWRQDAVEVWGTDATTPVVVTAKKRYSKLTRAFVVLEHPVVLGIIGPVKLKPELELPTQ